MLSADQASFAVRWESMETMVCSIFSGVKTDVCASVDLLLGTDILEICAVNCSLEIEVISVLVLAGSVIGGCNVKWDAVRETGALLDASIEITVGDGVIPRRPRGSKTNLSSGKLLGNMV